MDEPIKFDYYYGVEAEMFSFYRVPRLLIKDERFKGLSSNAKLLYGLMLDRMSLSMKNEWLDKENRAYIIYTVDSMMEDLGCARATCVKVIKELDCGSGIGLIEKKRRGLGKPDIIYVKNFAAATDKTAANADKSTEVQNLNFKKSNNYTSGSSGNESQEVQRLVLQKFKNQTSGNSETELAEVQKSDTNYTDYNQTNQNNTDVNHTNLINLSEGNNDMTDVMDRAAIYMAMIRENLEYEHHMKYDRYGDKEIFEEIYETICDVVCVKRETVRINGDDYPYELVKSRFLKLNGSHAAYVMERMKETAAKITNIRSYLITALYNAPTTINHYYQQEVQHDMMYGGVLKD